MLTLKAVVLGYSRPKKDKVKSKKAKGLNARQKRELKVFQIKPEQQRSVRDTSAVFRTTCNFLVENRFPSSKCSRSEYVARFSNMAVKLFMQHDKRHKNNNKEAFKVNFNQCFTIDGVDLHGYCHCCDVRQLKKLV